MSTFITRIELHNAVSGDYDRLHDAMQRAGFSRTIKGSGGGLYHLPTAEYWCEGSFTLDAVFKSAQAAAASVGKNFSIIASQTTSSMFNLPPAT